MPMERQIRNSLEALTNLVYLAKATLPADAGSASKFLSMAEEELNALIANLKPLLDSYTSHDED